jgi:hypothetical protein
MNGLTFACVLVKGHVTTFSPEYVVNLQRMVRRHCKRDHRFVCLTDRPELMPRFVETIFIPGIYADSKIKGWWSKVQLWNPLHDLGERVVYLDLDTLIVDSLEEIVTYPAPFALIPDGAPNFKPKGLTVVKLYNSSVMVWSRAWSRGEGVQLWSDWSPGVAKVFHGDQDWIGHKRPGEARMPLGWFPRLSERGEDIHRAWLNTEGDLRRSMPPDAKIILCKKPKNAEAAARWPWFRKAWSE